MSINRWCAFLFCLLATPAFADGRVALVMANGAYERAPLANPHIDAELVRRALDGIGFEVDVTVNASIDEFDAALQRFAAKAKGADVALFYYAGHGFAVSDRGGPRNYLMGIDADVTTTSERELRAGGMPLDDVIAAISSSAKTTLVFVDACRNDPSLSRAAGGQGRSAVALDTTVGENVFVGLSTRLGDVAADGEAGSGSPFARAFSANIGVPGARIDDAFTQVRLAVESETKRDQRPDVGRYDLSQPLVLVPEVRSAQDPAVCTGAQVQYEEAKSLNTPEVLRAFVEANPSCPPYTDYAAAMLTKLESNSTVKPFTLANQPEVSTTSHEPETLAAQLSSCWSMPFGMEAQDLRVTVRFELDANGKLADRPEIVKSSGSKALDESAVRAVQKCDLNGRFAETARKAGETDFEISFDTSLF
jgi:TonB family protein